MSTLIDTANDRIAELRSQRDAAIAALPGLRTDEASLAGAVQVARQDLLDAELAVQRLRDRLGGLELPAGAPTLADELQTARIARNQAAADLLGAQEALLRGQIATRQQQAVLDDCLRQLQSLDALATQWQARHATRQALLGRLAGARLPVQADAHTLLTTAGAGALTALQQDLPAALLTRLGERHAHLDAVQTRLQATRDAVEKLRASLDPDTAWQMALRRLAAAEAAGARLADEAAAGLAAVLPVLAAVAARSPRLSSDERAALAATPAAAPDRSTRADALIAQKAFDDARYALADKDGARRAIHLDLQLKNPDDFPPAAGARKTSYDNAQSAADGAQSQFDTAANTTYGPAERKAMDDWLVGMSAALADDLQATLSAVAALDAIDRADPAQLRSDIRDAESEAAAAWGALDLVRRKAAIAAAQAGAVSDWLDNDPGGDGRRMALGLRGAP